MSNEVFYPKGTAQQQEAELCRLQQQQQQLSAESITCKHNQGVSRLTGPQSAPTYSPHPRNIL